MELSSERQIDEATMKRCWRKVFFAQYAPLYSRYALFAVTFCMFGIMIPGLRGIMFALAAAYVMAMLWWYPRIWRIYRRMFMKTGAFEHPTTVRLTDTFMEVTCGANCSRNEYSVFSEYMELGDVIALFNQKSIAAIFPKMDFPDRGGEFMQCLKKAGVKRMEFWGIRRWWYAVLIIALVALLVISHIMDVQNRTWIYEKSRNAKCVSNLKVLMCGLLIYSSEQREAGNMAFPQSLPLDDMVAEGYLEKCAGACPLSSVEYVYVPYNRFFDRNSSTAASTPVLWDFLIGCHRNKSHHWLPWGKETANTIVIFEDQHFSIEKNLTRHKDIYDKYAPYMSREDAETLRRICEEYDGFEQ